MAGDFLAILGFFRPGRLVQFPANRTIVPVYREFPGRRTLLPRISDEEDSFPRHCRLDRQLARLRDLSPLADSSNLAPTWAGTGNRPANAASQGPVRAGDLPLLHKYVADLPRLSLEALITLGKVDVAGSTPCSGAAT